MTPYGKDRQMQMTMGCEYRKRTGACGCYNAPYGCRPDKTTDNKSNIFKISFPQGTNSYRELRDNSERANTNTKETVYNNDGIPVGLTNSNNSSTHPKPVPPPAPPPVPLPLRYPMEGSLKLLPAVGWQCSASDAAHAVAWGVCYLDAGGNADAESSLGTALGPLSQDKRGQFFLSTSVGLHNVKVAAEASLARLAVDKLDLLCLCIEDSKEVGSDVLIAAWSEMAALVDAGRVSLVGLRCADIVMAKHAFEQVVRIPGSVKVAVLQTAMHPLVPKLQRMLLGACRRNRCQMVALDPLGGVMSSDALKKVKALECEEFAEVLFSYNVGRGVAVLPSAAEGGTIEMTSKLIRPILPDHRFALDGLAPQA
mmetsp:Transcript_12528/g.17107  ORF Transcript_12528/g.17107 Transcript_12528/m.17107 type:complete len:368 (-) Transcript_12528:509-1612(-)|eukprot:CAMPEP_0196571588 /NCGR_PEP_ID=MMETSP1081-20130531/1752_1 /TAXON_ID=36882 /ORGANISM="Pyramimonas amylifera, Strain CCMP720" /LENGTH=367 /DNA_ID=CAMNT_0041888595 /DNA_START=122 /DNA_END=1225 /DNA_ORIENTATION=-